MRNHKIHPSPSKKCVHSRNLYMSPELSEFLRIFFAMGSSLVRGSFTFYTKSSFFFFMSIQSRCSQSFPATGEFFDNLSQNLRSIFPSNHRDLKFILQSKKSRKSPFGKSKMRSFSQFRCLQSFPALHSTRPSDLQIFQNFFSKFA